MDQDQLLAIFDKQVRFDSCDPLFERQAVPEDNPIVVRHVPLDPEARWGWVNWSRLTEANADRAITEQVAFFAGRGQNFEWKRFGYDMPVDLGERLLRYGFSREEHETVVVLDLAEKGFVPRAPVQGVEIQRITDPIDLDRVVAVEDAVWHASHAWIMNELSKELVLPGEPLHIYLAYADGIPAAAAWIRFPARVEFAALFGGSTLPQYRGRGLYTALLAVRAQAARERGYRFLSVDASEMSRPILEKHGFVAITTATAFKYRLTGPSEQS